MINKIVICVGLTLTVINGFSQDSIRFMNNNIIAAKIFEVSTTDIKYHRFDNLNGPQYIVNKQDIRYIKFANGTVDSIRVEVTKSTTEPNLEQKNETANLPTTSTDAPKIIIKRNRLVYNNRGLGEAKLWMLIDNFPSKEGKLKLMTEFNTMKKYKNAQYISGFSGLGLGLASVVAGFSLASADTHGTTTNNVSTVVGDIVGGAAIGVILGVTGSTISTIFKAKRLKKRREIAEMYNDLR
jgi:hypothetical protein